MGSDSNNEPGLPDETVAGRALGNMLGRLPEASRHRHALLEKACQQLGRAALGVPVGWFFAPTQSEVSFGRDEALRVTKPPGAISVTDLGDLDLMSGRQFERFLGDAFERKGYEVQYDAGPTEAGGDLVCWKRSHEERHAILVQAKRERCLTGTKAIGQILRKENSFRHQYPGVSYDKWVISSSRFSPQALAEAVAGRIRLLDRDGLALWLAAAED